MKRLHLVSCLLLVLAAPTAAFSQDHHDHAAPAVPPGQRIGTVDFRTSCKPAVRDEFNRATALLHSFWFSESRRTFEKVLQTDPDCAMAYWGIALTHWSNPFAGLRSAQIIETGRASIQKGRQTGSPTAREKGFIEAVALLFSDTDPGTQPARVASYEAAMGRVAAMDESDVEARIFWALAITQSARPTDKTFANQLRAGAILEPLFRQMPSHPGLAHYIIHAYDAPALANKALPAARAYADIAPAVPHALHMPSHTFTRAGLWKESAATNAKSAQVAEQAGEAGDALHALDYMTYAFLQMGMDTEAAEAMRRAKTLAGGERVAAAATPAAIANPFAIAAIPARFMLERQNWAGAAQLDVIPTPNLPYVEAMTRFARAVGASRSGNPSAAQADIDQLAVLRDREIELKDPYWAGIIDIQHRGARAWQRYAEGKREEAMRLMADAADAEDATDKAGVTPGPLAPAREMLGFMLLDSGKSADALSAFEAVIVKEPNRFLALWGAAQAAGKVGKPEEAAKHYRQLAEICRDAGPGRAELDYARQVTKR